MFTMLICVGGVLIYLMPWNHRNYGFAGWMNVHGVVSESFGTSTAMR